jgi:hypothetical protein
LGLCGRVCCALGRTLVRWSRQPSTLDTLDNDIDASTPCIVAQRASIAQGRALIGGEFEEAVEGGYWGCAGGFVVR